MGGTYNPPHAGHVAIANTALTMLKLDALWWLVTPQNPLKRGHDIPPAEDRMALCKDLVSNPKIIVSDLECHIGSFSTYESAKNFRYYFPKSEFVWVAGYDNALNFHKWEHWQDLLAMLPFCFIARPPAISLIENCPLRLYDSAHHKSIEKASKWPLKGNICYYILQMHMISLSSTQIRKTQGLQ